MEEHRWTNYRLEKESKLSHFTVTKMFNRNNAPTLPTLEAVCKVFGITMTQFFSDDELHALTPEQQKLFFMCNSLTDEQNPLLLNLMHTM